jgi:hypothetical protein
MLSVENQEAVIVKAFFQEFEKTAGPKWNLFKTRVFGTIADVAAAKQQKVKGKVQTFINEVQKELNETPTFVQRSKVIEEQEKKNKNLLGTAAALGLGAAGFGYYQYKRDLNDRLATNYPQVSRG